jgi:hypothetical protein
MHMTSRIETDCAYKVTEKDGCLPDLDISFSHLAVWQIARLYIQGITHLGLCLSEYGDPRRNGSDQNSIRKVHSF